MSLLKGPKMNWSKFQKQGLPERQDHVLNYQRSQLFD